ncbi:CheR family methyltransferase [Wenxinia saemankumensis]|uniref:Chemotaxis protein methyltransferase n=1 Tax=Wenxinia saemankumensis TaxID=1447782 RepID=A0A1M6DQK5_9RHOB|nr:protein-glutamate O-methyltransferase CheR [Wenxinia saemankumensis]SHI75534.1 MCP methyltransferase, CheR-type [Wenxinia saemankumensis]
MRSAAHIDAPRTAPGQMTDAQFATISAVAHSEYGLNLEESKKSLILSRLSKRLTILGLDDFGAYCRLIESGDPTERDHFVNAITTNVTHFFREPHHFDHLAGEALPRLVGEARAGKRVRLWSAGCSTGQEAYSIAATVTSILPDAGRHDLRILATDIDTNVLATAETGRYDDEVVRALDTEKRRRLFSQDGGPGHGIRRDLKNLVTFRQLNINKPWPMTGRFDVIFFRNVAIYFDREVQERLWSRFADVLRPGGFLYIGHSERVSGPAAASLKSCAVTTYSRI